MTSNHPIYQKRAQYSKMRLEALSGRLNAVPEVTGFPQLTIFAAGSYARLEASEYSDIDMFFLTMGRKGDLPEPRTAAMRLFGKLIQIADELRFPEFSNDCKYLTLLHSDDILEHLGSPRDDHENYFTTRMLLLLEGRCVYGDTAFEGIVADIVRSYFKDFPDHKQTFQPVFLVNDICRFWKTLLLNYENKRKLSPRGLARPGLVHEADALAPAAPSDEVMEQQRTIQKVRNFKLKYSRMTTCFASIAALGSYRVPVTEEQVVGLTKLTPRERLESVTEHLPKAANAVKEVLRDYTWFLEMTGLQTEDLRAHFSDKQKRIEMFGRANEYGDSMYKLLEAIDDAAATDAKHRLLRYLVI